MKETRLVTAACDSLPSIQYRACASSYVVFAVIFGLPLGLSIFVLVKSGDPSCWQLVVIFFTVLIFAFVWLSRFRLEFTADTVAYASLFSREQKVLRSDIVSADFAEWTGPFESPFTFVIQTKGGAEIRVNAKVFSREAVQALCGLLGPPPHQPS